MGARFEAVPVEVDTSVIFEIECKLDAYEVLYQRWIWEGIEAESMIFAEDDLNKMDDDTLERLVRSSPMVESESKTTISRFTKGFAFVNFNFRARD